MTDKKIDVTERLQKIGETVSEYKDSVMNLFKDMDVEVKDWHFTVGNVEKGYIVEVNLKLSIRPKNGPASISEKETKGKIEKTKGKIREVGKITGDKSEQIKGKAEQVKGKVKEEIGKAKGKTHK